MARPRASSPTSTTRRSPASTSARSRAYWFKGASGGDIHGWIVYPPGYDATKSYPLVQIMHGGPHTMQRDSWSYRWNTHVLASPGYVVTWVNRHGSTGFGEKFSQSIVNQWGDMPFEDIMKSTDYLLGRFPNLDAKRMAAAGASYGGYMAAWVLGHTDRFSLHHQPRRRQQLLQPVRDRRAARLRQGHGRARPGRTSTACSATTRCSTPGTSRRRR